MSKHFVFPSFLLQFFLLRLSLVIQEKAFDKSFQGAKCVSIAIVSSNINEVIRAILNFFIQNFHNRKKEQNAYKRTKIKNAPKRASKGKIVTYLLICVLCFCPSVFMSFSAFGVFCAFGAFWCFCLSVFEPLSAFWFFQYFALSVFMPFSAFQCFRCFQYFLVLFVHAKSFGRKKNNEFKTARITSFILLLTLFIEKLFYRGWCTNKFYCIGQRVPSPPVFCLISSVSFIHGILK